MIYDMSRMVAVKATFDGERIVLPEEVRGMPPGRVIVVFEDAADAEDRTLWLKAQEGAFAKVWDNPEDEVYDRCDPGAIVLVRFPFTDLSTTKKRPALVVSPVSYGHRFGDVVLMPLASQDQNDPSLALSEWQAAGLPKPTWIKPLSGHCLWGSSSVRSAELTLGTDATWGQRWACC